MKILLTGATGFIGANFLRQALARGHEIAALATPGKSAPAILAANPNLTWLNGTLAAAPWREMAAFAADACVHTAWVTTPGTYLESPENRQFLQDSRAFVESAVKSGVKHVVVLGTCIEYQITRELLSEARTPIAPVSLYARCKNDLRVILESAAAREGWSLAWARVFYPYGPGEHPARLGSSLMQKLARDEKIVLQTPDSTKDYIYIDDLAAALLAVVEQKFRGAINVGTGVGVTVRDVARTLAMLLGKPDLVAETQPAQADPLGYVVADAGRLRGLGWQPRFDLPAGLAELVAARKIATRLKPKAGQSHRPAFVQGVINPNPSKSTCV